MAEILDYEQKLAATSFLINNRFERKEDGHVLADKMKKMNKGMLLEDYDHETLPTPEEVIGKCSDWGITAELKPHQARGVSWLIKRYFQGVNVILGDEMGLGKTLQAITLLSYLKVQQKCKGPFLVLCPLSVTDGWATEFTKFSPTLRILRYVGEKETRIELRHSVITYRDEQTFRSTHEDLPFDVCLTTYELAMLDAIFLSQIQWGYTIIDEAQRIKNPSSVLYKTLQSQFMIPRCLLLTGTPVQNNLSELWALLHFCMPKVFGELKEFISAFKEVASISHGDHDSKKGKQYRLLRYVMCAFMLRRTKALLIKNGTLTLPSLSDVTVLAPLSSLQRKVYASVLQKELPKLLINSSSGYQSQSLQNIVVHLRKACSHPYLFPGVEPEPFEEGEHLVEASGKLIILDVLLEKLHEQGHRVLVFAQMTRTIDILQDFLEMRKYSYERLDGSVRAEERFAAVKLFSAEGTEVPSQNNRHGYNDPYKPFVFLISTRAGGVGLNLTGADTAIFYEQDWNPQVDKQALQRTHRIGQLHHVLSINIVTENTVEEVIMHRAKRKLQLCDNVIGRDDALSTTDTLDGLGTDDLRSLIIFGLHKFDPAGDIEKSSPELNIIELKNMAENILRIRKDPNALKYTGQPPESEDEAIYDFTGNSNSFRKYSEKYSDKDMINGRSVDHRIYQSWISKANDQVLDIGTEINLIGSKRTRSSNMKALEAARLEKKKKMDKKKHAHWEACGYKTLAVEDDTENMNVGSNLDSGEVKFVFGDCTKPIKENANDPTIIFSCMDNSGKWGKGGLFDALAKLSKKVPESYMQAHKFKDLNVGDLHLVSISENLVSNATNDSPQWVALGIVQTYNSRRKVPRSEISMPHLDTCLRKLCFSAFGKSASVHMPRIGFRQGEGHKEWYTIERMLHKYAAAFGVKINVYYFKRPRI